MILKDWKTKKNIVIDSGALKEYYLLLLEESKRRYAKENFKLFSDFLENKKLYVVPQVFAEIYSLLKRDAKIDSKLIYWLEKIKKHFEDFIEEHIQKDEILKDKSFLKFGFTDIALSKIIRKDWIFLSNDQPLINLCNSRDLEAHHIEEILIY
ncbi:hypothetical protein ES705_10173 [subsurface metagenome]|jgi:hypothetical protein